MEGRRREMKTVKVITRPIYALAFIVDVGGCFEGFSKRYGCHAGRPFFGAACALCRSIFKEEK
jgi:hypothetical protein